MKLVVLLFLQAGQPSELKIGKQPLVGLHSMKVFILINCNICINIEF